MAQRRVDRWWMILVAFLAAAAMVLLVLLTETIRPRAGRPRDRPQRSSTMRHSSGMGGGRSEPTGEDDVSAGHGEEGGAAVDGGDLGPRRDRDAADVGGHQRPVTPVA